MGEKKQPAHQALYRKYRSRSLSEVVGQEHITLALANAVKSGRLSHAYLFTGPRGVGKTSVARILAHEVNQLPYTDDSLQLDIIEIDAASNRRIDDIRDLRDKVNLAPVNAPYKVYIIDEVHMLTPESFNALLKTLEEPPAHVIFILATTEAHKLPATIISRTQRHTFRTVPVKQMAAHLSFICQQEELKVEPAALELIARHGEGSFRDSISLLDQISYLPQPVTKEALESLLGIAGAEELDRLLTDARRGDTAGVLSTLDTMYAKGYAPQHLASQLLQLLRRQATEPGSLSLMKDLLAVQSALQPGLALEISLLEHALETECQPATEPVKPTPKTAAPEKAASAPAQPATAPAPTPPAPTATPKPAAPRPKTKKPAAKKSSPEPDASLEIAWPLILQALKRDNSSLYTVMRLAEPRLAEHSLTVAFRFPFHQKRLQEARSLSLLTKLASEQLGRPIEVSAVVDSSLQTAKSAEAVPPPPADPAHASLISSVQDIMGGGEIVDA